MLFSEGGDLTNHHLFIYYFVHLKKVRKTDSGQDRTDSGQTQDRHRTDTGQTQDRPVTVLTGTGRGRETKCSKQEGA